MLHQLPDGCSCPSAPTYRWAYWPAAIGGVNSEAEVLELPYDHVRLLPPFSWL